MKFTIFGFCVATLIALGALSSRSTPLLAADSNSTNQATFDRLIHALQIDNRDVFLKDATDEMKQALTPEVLTGVSHDISPHLEKGFQGLFLCDLNQHGCQVQLWKITFKDGRDDAVVRIALRDGHLAGFFIQ